MSILVTDCPRCGAEKMTFDLTQEQLRKEINYGWQMTSEVFCVCRNCELPTIFVLAQKKTESESYFSNRSLSKYSASVNQIASVQGFIAIKDFSRRPSPDHLPKDIDSIFLEGATCLAVQCFNAAGTMFRLCVDLATQPLLPPSDTVGLNLKTRRDLGLRLPWLFENGKLPEELKDLSTCIKEDGNDGAHRGTLQKEEAEDLCDFTYDLLERLYTAPARLKQAEERRMARRASQK